MRTFICGRGVYILVYFTSVTDPPPAEALLLTDEYVRAQIEEHLVDEKYNRILLLDVEDKDKERFEQAEERRREKDVVLPTIPGKPDKKSKGKKSEYIYFV